MAKIYNPDFTSKLVFMDTDKLITSFITELNKFIKFDSNSQVNRRTSASFGASGKQALVFEITIQHLTNTDTEKLLTYTQFEEHYNKAITINDDLVPSLAVPWTLSMTYISLLIHESSPPDFITEAGIFWIWFFGALYKELASYKHINFYYYDATHCNIYVCALDDTVVNIEITF